MRTHVSVPGPVLDFALNHGAQWLYFRRDNTKQMWRLPLADVRTVGKLGRDTEWYVAIEAMQPTPWRWWPDAEQAVHLSGADAVGVVE